MSHDAANLLNAELGDDQQWKRGLQHEKTSSPPIGTLHQITRSLDTEGFNQHSLQVIERFLNHHSFILAKHRQAFRRLKKRFAAFMRPCPENERQMVGRFIAAQCSHSFEAGLRLGMTGRLMDVDDANDSEEDDVDFVNAWETCEGCCTDEADCQTCINKPPQADGEDDHIDSFDTCETCGGCCEDCTEEADCQTCIDNRPQADGEDDQA